MSLDVDLMVDGTAVYSANITHNLTQMADAIGIYKHVWRPEEIGVKKARELIQPLRAGLELLLSDEQRFRQYDAENKWGTYPQFVGFLGKYLAACELNPDADVEVSR